MSRHKARAPLTAASERRLSLRARSMLDEAARRSYLDRHLVTIAAGMLLRVAEHTGETAARLMTRLRITATRRVLIERCGQHAEAGRGEMPPPVIKRFLAINKTKPSCVRGRQCTCTQRGQRTRCAHYWRVDIAAGELGDGDARGVLDARPIPVRGDNTKKKSCVRGDDCTCTSYTQRIRCGNRRHDPAAFDFAPHNAPWTGDDEPTATTRRGCDADAS